MLWGKQRQSWILWVLGVESELETTVMMQERDGNSLDWAAAMEQVRRAQSPDSHRSSTGLMDRTEVECGRKRN